MSRALRLLIVPLLAACPSDPPITGEDPEPGSEAGSTAGPLQPVTTGDATGTDTTGGTLEPGTDSSGTGFDPPEPACGNGYLEDGEECDDGNSAEDDGCTTACQIPCGLAQEMIELAPSAQSNISGVRVLAAADGSITVIGARQEITLDMEGMQDNGPRQAIVVAYEPDGSKRWERLLGPNVGDLDPVGGAVLPDGDVFVAAAIDGDDGVDVWVARLAAADGDTVWTHAHDGTLDGSDDVPGGLAVTPDGDVVVSAQVYDADQDSDVWLRKLDGGAGEPVWTTTWTGQVDNGFSVDQGKDVVVDAAGNVLVLAHEYVNYKRNEITLLKFGDDGDPLWSYTPLADGTDHKHEATGLAVDELGEATFAVSTASGANFWLFKVGNTGDPLWDLAKADFVTEDEDWVMGGVAVASDGDLLVGGYWYNVDDQNDTGWYETWMARLQADGARRCQVSARGVGDDLVPPSLLAYDIGGGPDGVALATGRKIENDEYALWTGVFRPL